MPKIVRKAKTKRKPKRQRIQKGTLRSALLADIKAERGRKDIEFVAAGATATDVLRSVPIEQRAGYPLTFPKDSANPKHWQTQDGQKVMVDFARKSWLPDSWGQGVKATKPTAHSTGTSGGTYTLMINPEGKAFYHRKDAEEWWGNKFSDDDGRNGQIRLAKLQAEQAVQLARKSIKDIHKSEQNVGVDSDKSFFKLLSTAEQKCIPAASAFHFGVVSARRASNIEGVRDVFMVQSQLLEAGVTPVWYVDEASVKDYQRLGLNAVVGGKLTAARNMVLQDARRRGKICVQMSDDISAWEYRHGKKAAARDDNLINAAHAAAKRFVVSPVAAARFLVAKMRAAPLKQKPKLGGCYMLGSCARTFAGDECSFKHFILGDFLVVDKGSAVNFDVNMTLKEDYDFTCSHLKAHGSVLRCNRMTLNVKHYSNSGGACSNRDKKGEQERKNVAILMDKWPGSFKPNPKRKNEVIMRWKGAPDDEENAATSKKIVPKSVCVKKTALKKNQYSKNDAIPRNAIVRTTSKGKEKKGFVANRLRKLNNKKVSWCVTKVSFRDGHGRKCHYKIGDLAYDIACGCVSLSGGSAKKAA